MYYNKEKIIMMSKLAIYDKNFGKTDKKNVEFFRQDFAYRKNAVNRIWIFFACVISSGFYVLHEMIFNDFDVLNFEYSDVIRNVIIFIVGALVFYTLVGTAISLREYNQSERRLEKYYNLLAKLNEIRSTDETEEASDYAANLVYKRSDY